MLDAFLGEFFLGLTGFERCILLQYEILINATYFKLPSSFFGFFVCLVGIVATSDQILIECG